MDGAVDVAGLAVALELENALRDGGDDGVVSSLDVGEETGEALVVVVHFRRPDDRFIGI